MYEEDEDFSFVNTIARIAVYDDLLSAPRIIEIAPAATDKFIESLASSTYDYAQRQGGKIPYSAIREVTENFIHARFKEIVVSILDAGNTIRFADQGPGIQNKDKAQLPGFTSATEPMKGYIRGVGSGLPLVKEYLSFTHGRITIEDNLSNGAVVTLSLTEEQADTRAPKEPKSILIPTMNEREKAVTSLLYSEGSLGITEIVNLIEIPASSAFNTLKALEEMGVVERVEGKKRVLTDFGDKVARSLL